MSNNNRSVIAKTLTILVGAALVAVLSVVLYFIDSKFTHFIL